MLNSRRVISSSSSSIESQNLITIHANEYVNVMRNAIRNGVMHTAFALPHIGVSELVRWRILHILRSLHVYDRPPAESYVRWSIYSACFSDMTVVLLYSSCMLRYFPSIIKLDCICIGYSSHTHTHAHTVGVWEHKAFALIFTRVDYILV